MSRSVNPAFTILGAVFTTIGAIFTALGLGLGIGLSSKIDDAVAFTAAFGGTGLIFLVLGVSFLAVEFKKRAKRRELRLRGNYIEATVTGVQPNFSVQVNGRCAWEVTCIYQDRYGERHLFKSSPVFFNPAPFLPEGAKVKVYVDGDDFECCDVALDEALADVRIHETLSK